MPCSRAQSAQHSNLVLFVERPMYMRIDVKHCHSEGPNSGEQVKSCIFKHVLRNYTSKSASD